MKLSTKLFKKKRTTKKAYLIIFFFLLRYLNVIKYIIDTFKTFYSKIFQYLLLRIKLEECTITSIYYNTRLW